MEADEEPDLAPYFARPQLERVIDQGRHALVNVRDLSEWACEESPLGDSMRTIPVLVACRESFYVSSSTVAEFFVRMPLRDYTARDYLPTWVPRKALASRLDRVWLVASKHVVHLSRDRVPADASTWAPEDMSYRALRGVGRDCWRVADAFSQAYESAGGGE